MSFFKRVTSTTPELNLKNAVIMGRVTWESIPSKFRPLPQRLNVVVTRNVQEKKQELENENVRVVSSLRDALELVSTEPLSREIHKVFVIGGGQIYQAAFSHPELEEIYLTRILSPSFDDCDTFMPAIDSSIFQEESVSEKHCENDIEYEFVKYRRIVPSGGSRNKFRAR
eukprot:TRINITY_DN7467_c0_g2_i4.p1 TRINITY_DN7467_c0_g2~~TRINITY_DN7467_c0_g2_i4.p1  ORF type:complete len:170 (+),score=9.30 TRINITY_DN7467_c0_g2_i4:46-555(+)